MYTGDGRHYFSLSISALRHVERALRAAGAAQPDAVLDMPCGFGRVLRTLVARFPEAVITACDIRPRAVRFCSRRFGAEAVVSSATFDQLTFFRPFDLIWCGSLVTHLEPSRALSLVDLFARSLSPGGVVVFTSHGEAVAGRIGAGADYMLPANGVRSLMRLYEHCGYGYADYPWESGYGVSVVSPDWIRGHVEGRGELREIYFAERGWDAHHDVFGFVSGEPGSQGRFRYAQRRSSARRSRRSDGGARVRVGGRRENAVPSAERLARRR
jgi:SAM-dependent methyltransferase